MTGPATLHIPDATGWSKAPCYPAADGYRFHMRHLVSLLWPTVLALGCSVPVCVPAPGCTADGPLLVPDEQDALPAVTLGDGCQGVRFNGAAPEGFVVDCAAYLAAARDCAELATRQAQCDAIGIACGLIVPVP